MENTVLIYQIKQGNSRTREQRNSTKKVPRDRFEYVNIGAISQVVSLKLPTVIGCPPKPKQRQETTLQQTSKQLAISVNIPSLKYHNKRRRNPTFSHPKNQESKQINSF